MRKDELGNVAHDRLLRLSRPGRAQLRVSELDAPSDVEVADASSRHIFAKSSMVYALTD